MNRELLQVTCDSLESLKARDIVALDVSGRTTVTECMVIATGTSGRHVCSVANKVIEDAKAHGGTCLGVEGMEFGEWVLIDLDEIVVHVMQDKTRRHYMLENLWIADSASPTS